MQKIMLQCSIVHSAYLTEELPMSGAARRAASHPLVPVAGSRVPYFSVSSSGECFAISGIWVSMKRKVSAVKPKSLKPAQYLSASSGG